jgi:uncharacterized protein
LDDDAIMIVLAKEAKQRQESADVFAQAGEPGRSAAELQEKGIIDRYLPEALSGEAIGALVERTIKEIGEVSPQTMGRIIGQVKQQAGVAADGALIARLVKERLPQ